MPTDALLLIGIGFIASLVGIIYWIGRERDNKQDRELSDHAKEDLKTHEDVAVLKTEMAALKDAVGPLQMEVPIIRTEVSTLKKEMESIRNMRHEMMTHVTHSLASWFEKVVEMISKRYNELVAMIERLK